MFGAIATSIEASKDYIYPEVTTLKRGKSIYTVSLIFFFNLAAATGVIPLLTVDADQCGVNAWHWEGPRSGCGACVINNTASLPRAHSMQGSQGGCKLLQIHASTKGDLPRYFAQKMRNLLIKHWTSWVSWEETLFSQRDRRQQLQKARAHKREHRGNGGADQHGVRHSPMPPALFLNLLTLNSNSNHNNRDKTQKAPSLSVDKNSIVNCQLIIQSLPLCLQHTLQDIQQDIDLFVNEYWLISWIFIECLLWPSSGLVDEWWSETATSLPSPSVW